MTERVSVGAGHLTGSQLLPFLILHTLVLPPQGLLQEVLQGPLQEAPLGPKHILTLCQSGLGQSPLQRVGTSQEPPQSLTVISHQGALL